MVKGEGTGEGMYERESWDSMGNLKLLFFGLSSYSMNIYIHIQQTSTNSKLQTEFMSLLGT
jgi:hypothetical protein